MRGTARGCIVETPSWFDTHGTKNPFECITDEGWREAMGRAAMFFTEWEIAAGWPVSMNPRQIAALQHPASSPERTRQNRARGIGNADNAPMLNVRWLDLVIELERAIEWAIRNNRVQSYNKRITAPAFAAWLAEQGETPSKYTQAWFDAVGASGQPNKPTLNQVEIRDARQAARYKACLDERLIFSDNPLHPMPRGVGKVAKKLGITRQSLTADLIGYIDAARTQAKKQPIGR